MGTLVCELKNQKPVEQFAEFLPDLDEELNRHEMFTEYTIKDGGVIPCRSCPVSEHADKMILVQSSEEESVEIGICSLLNILDAAEVMESGTVTIPLLSSFPPNIAACHMVTWAIDFAHTVKDESLKTIKLVCPDQY